MKGEENAEMQNDCYMQSKRRSRKNNDDAESRSRYGGTGKACAARGRKPAGRNKCTNGNSTSDQDGTSFFFGRENTTDTEVETETNEPKFTVEFEFVTEPVTEHEIEPETTAPTETKRTEETTDPAKSESETDPLVPVATAPKTECIPEAESFSTTAEIFSTHAETEVFPGTVPEAEQIHDVEFNIDY